jgi:xanthine dehydrogenase YagR molybdenum-binding subunit
VRASYHSQAPPSLDEAQADTRVSDDLVGEPAELEIGDAEAALTAAPHAIDQRYSTPRHNHTRSSCTPSRSPGTAVSFASTMPHRR